MNMNKLHYAASACNDPIIQYALREASAKRFIQILTSFVRDIKANERKYLIWPLDVESA